MIRQLCLFWVQDLLLIDWVVRVFYQLFGGELDFLVSFSVCCRVVMFCGFLLRWWLLFQCEVCVRVVVIICGVLVLEVMVGLCCSLCSVCMLWCFRLKCSMLMLLLVIVGGFVCSCVSWLDRVSCIGFSRGELFSSVSVSIIQYIQWLIGFSICSQWCCWCSMVSVQFMVQLVVVNVMSIVQK